VYKVEVYARVRRAVQVDGMSVRQAAREFGLSRKTIRKMLQFSLPPGYERKKPVLRPKLGPWEANSNARVFADRNLEALEAQGRLMMRQTTLMQAQFDQWVQLSNWRTEKLQSCRADGS
jgi:transposase